MQIYIIANLITHNGRANTLENTNRQSFIGMFRSLFIMWVFIQIKNEQYSLNLGGNFYASNHGNNI